MEKLRELLMETDYDRTESLFLLEGFENRFGIRYQGKTDVRRRSPNLKITVSSETILWNKVMKEVQLKRHAGPYPSDSPPFQFYIQSPIGLILKDNGRDMRLIFHLSYPRTGESINSGMPRELASVQYPDFSEAIKRCLEDIQLSDLGVCVAGKSDMKSAFCNLGLRPDQFYLLLMTAKSPIDGRWYLFVEKCLPFGASISCSHFQRLSNCVAHILKVKTHKVPINFLDDYLFIAALKSRCDGQLRTFLHVCDLINFPVALEKTHWSATVIIFLGLLIDMEHKCISVPADKVRKAQVLIAEILEKKSKKTTVKELQCLCGFLNFLCRCIVPGRVFTRRLYAKFNSSMKPHHHISINSEMRSDLKLWQQFLLEPAVYARPFLDFTRVLTGKELDLFTDASGAVGCGGIFGNKWFQMKWSPSLLARNPSIAFLELYAVTAAVLMWGTNFSNCRVCLYCDNQSCCAMINQMTSSCRSCMVLLWKLVLYSMVHNIGVFAKYVRTQDNYFADALSRFEMVRFAGLADQHE